MAQVRPFRALRYSAAAGPLERLVAPPYDVISAEDREQYLALDPHNVVHLTLPDSEEQAARELVEWQAEGVLEREPEPTVWALSQSYTGPDGVARTRNGLVVTLRLEPYENRVVLPHERTHAGPKEGRLRLLRSTRTQLEPIFLLHDGDPVEIPPREPDLAAGGDRLWRVEEDPGARFADAQLLIADGHHRYETALAFHEEDGTEASAWMMVVLVSTREEGLTIFPTHRLAESVDGIRGTSIDEPGDELPGVVLYRRGGYELLEGEGLDVEVVDALAPQGVRYTPQRGEAVAAVDRGEAEAAFLLRPTRIEEVFARAREGQVLPQKTTYFFPKLTSGLLFQPLD
jgi:uncharacterized protein (DUF1015 family)